MSRVDEPELFEVQTPATVATDVRVHYSLSNALAGKLADEMNRAWKQGRRVRVEELLLKHPDLGQQRDAVLRLVCEEFCLRREAGMTLDLDDWHRRFPEWRLEIDSLLECQKAFEPEIHGTPSKALGNLHDYRLLAELGQGGLGRVYLAVQPDLGDRPVVIKLTPCRGREHLSLARLQHTHIVPLYGAQDYPEENQRILCMPYFGRVTLALIMAALQKVPLAERRCQHVFDALDRLQVAVLPVEGPRGPTRQMLARANYAQAIVWMGACLADALHYAHQRDLLHLDIKPSNVLWTTDGQPMLLDFHLARPPIHPDGPRPHGLGGTPLHMAPEQEAALNAAHRREPIPQAVDGRADIFGLGLLLHQALGGPFPFPIDQPPRLDAINPQVSVGLADIILKCLSPVPALRYADAEAVASDLNRHLRDQPLRGVPNRSLRERWQKWRRRSPHALRSIFLLLAIPVLLATSLGVWILNKQQAEREVSKRLEQAETALNHAKAHVREQKPDLALVTLNAGRALLPDVPRAQELRDALAEQQRLAAGQRARQALHRGLDELRAAMVIDVLTPAKVADLEKLCRRSWENRELILQEADVASRRDVIDLAVIWSDLRMRQASSAAPAQLQRDIVLVLDEAEKRCGTSPLLDQARATHLATLGEPARASQSRDHRDAFSPWEHVAQARLYLQRTNSPHRQAAWLVRLLGPGGHAEHAAGTWVLSEPFALAQASWHADQALSAEPNLYWAHFYQGICAYRQKRYADAMTAFRVCIALEPRHPSGYYNRALAAAGLRDFTQALADNGKALELDPGFGAAALNRALVHVELRDYDAAIADLHLARTRGVDADLVQSNLAVIAKRQKKTTPRD